MQGHWPRNCTKDPYFVGPQRRSPSAEKTRLAAMLGRLFRAQPDGTSGRGPDRNQGRRKGADPEGMALFVGPVFLNKIRLLCLFAGGGSHRRGGFFVRWGRGAPPVPAAAGVNLLRSPAPGGGGGREGEGARAAGGSARGRRTRQRTGPARNRPEPPRAGGGAAGAPPPRNGPRAAEGGMAGRAPCGALARQGGGRGRRKRPGAARERPRRGRGQAAADPRQRRGLPMRPTLFAPAQTPGGGEHGASGARSGGRSWED